MAERRELVAAEFRVGKGWAYWSPQGTPWYQRPITRAIAPIPLLLVAYQLFGMFLQVRGYQSMLASRLPLYTAACVVVLAGWLFASSLPKLRLLIGISLTLVIGIGAWSIDQATATKKSAKNTIGSLATGGTVQPTGQLVPSTNPSQQPKPTPKATLPKRGIPKTPNTEKPTPAEGAIKGTDNTLVGQVPYRSITGDGNTIVGATDANGNTILNRGGTAIGNGANAGPSDIAIGAHANAGATQQPPSQQCNTGSQCNSAGAGGIINNPTVINNPPNPLPQITVSESTLVPPHPDEDDAPTTFRHRHHFYRRDPFQENPGASVTIQLEGPFKNPAFMADCSVPCAFSTQSLLESSGAASSVSTQFAGQKYPSQMMAGVAYKIPLLAGQRIQITFRSLDGRSLVVSNVRPYDLYASPPQHQP